MHKHILNEFLISFADFHCLTRLQEYDLPKCMCPQTFKNDQIYNVNYFV